MLISGQLRFWNPDDLNASQNVSSPTQDWIEEKLQEVCEHLGITRDGHLNRKKLVSICEQYLLQNVDTEVGVCFPREAGMRWEASCILTVTRKMSNASLSIWFTIMLIANVMINSKAMSIWHRTVYL